MTGSGPGASDPGPAPDLDAELVRLSGAVRDGQDLLVALDFDGVLAPLVDVPSQSRPTARGAAAMNRLATLPGVHLALVSGRGLADLAEVATPPDGTILVGSHGAERGSWQGRLEREPHVLDDERSQTLAALVDSLRDAVAGTAARVEAKPTTAVLHTRGVDAGTAEQLAGRARAIGDRPGVDVMTGRDVVELSVLTVTKGDAVQALRTDTGAGHVLFAGDDVTDERAMAVLGAGDVSIRVGDGESVATHRVADPDAMAATLDRLADLLTAG